ncbi:MAG: hypothetical protein JKY22_10090 [Flavobacteriaceae bacterium]|nr:hypothetical protein [Flavobacteriaceae bacterium]
MVKYDSEKVKKHNEQKLSFRESSDENQVFQFKDNRPQVEEQKKLQILADEYIKQKNSSIQQKKKSNQVKENNTSPSNNSVGKVDNPKLTTQLHLKKGMYKVSGTPNLRKNNSPLYSIISQLSNNTKVQVNNDSMLGSKFTILGFNNKEHTWGTVGKQTGWITDDKLTKVSDLPASEKLSSPVLSDSKSNSPHPKGNIRLLGSIQKPEENELSVHEKKYNFILNSTNENLANYNFKKRIQISEFLEELSSAFPKAYKNIKKLKDSDLQSKVSKYIKPTINFYIGPREDGHSLWLGFKEQIPSLLKDAYAAGYPIENIKVQKLIAKATMAKTEMESKGTGSSGHNKNFRR